MTTDSDVVEISRPEAGARSVVTVDNASKISFDFDLDNVTLELRDIDLIVTLPDGSSVVLVGFGLRLFYDPPIQLEFLNGTLTAQEVLEQVAAFIGAESEVQPELIVQEGRGDSEAGASPEGQNAISAVFVQQQRESDEDATDNTKNLVEVSRVTVPERRTAQYVENVPASRQTQAEETTPVPPSVETVTLSAVSLALSQNSSSQSADGFTFRGGLSAGQGPYTTGVAAGRGRDTILGSNGADEIFSDDPDLTSLGTSARLVEVTATMRDPNWEIRGLTISGLPPGGSIVGSTNDSGKYKLEINPNSPTVSSFVLQYALPDGSEEAGAGGFFSRFQLQLEYSVFDPSTSITFGVSAFLPVGVRAVSTEEDAAAIDPITGKQILVIWSNPAGTVVDAGAGDDTVFGGAGADSLSGGAGVDTLSYALSREGVRVNLETGAANSGYASGDTIAGFENVIGSRAADVLTGDQGANVLSGLAGPDTLDGGAGSDTADYATSGTGVTVNLSLGQQTSQGDADGDVLISIENLRGSSHDDALTGDAGQNVLIGGDGNDTLAGLAGIDSLFGGNGADWADYSVSKEGIAVDLRNAGPQLSGGDAQGDILSSVENILGSNFDDVLTGSQDRNHLIGGSGNDVFYAIGGGDVLDGSGGIDTVDYSLSEVGVSVSLSQTVPQQATGSRAGDVLVSIEALVGSAFRDLLEGNTEGNLLAGGDGNDILSGLEGGDTLDGGNGIDTADYSKSAAGVSIDLTVAGPQVSAGHASNDVLRSVENVVGSQFDDRLSGDSQDNSLMGGAGNDTLSGLAGSDHLDGGDGSDTVDYSASAEGVTVNLRIALGQQSRGDAAGDVLTSIENVTGSDFDDVFVASNAANLLDGRSGFDLVDYSSSVDGVSVDLRLNVAQQSTGDAANDVLRSIEGVIGTAAADRLLGSAADNGIFGGQGDDILAGFEGADTLVGGLGLDTADYSESDAGVSVDLTNENAQVSEGHAQGDVLTGIEAVIGSRFNDIFVSNETANTFAGGDGVDTVAYSRSTSAVQVNLSLVGPQSSGGFASGDTMTSIENVIGSEFADSLSGDDFANQLSGDAGNDTLSGGLGADTLNGGAGTDTADYSQSASAVQVNLASELAQISDGDAAGDLLISIENIIGSSLNDRLEGNSDGNALLGGDGDDTLQGRAGADTIDGGAGIDTADYASSSQAVTVDLRSTLQSSSGDAALDMLLSIENVSGSANNDVLTGNADANLLSGRDGDDTLAGLGGADTLNGGLGLDTASYAISSQGVTVNLSLETAQVSAGDASGDLLIAIENLIGSQHADSLSGNAEANILFGGLGNDTLAGLAGADELFGGDGTDTADYASSSRGVSVDLGLASAQISDGDAQGDILSSIENLSGSNFNDTLAGNSQANVLSGGAGDDILLGRGGADTLFGGAGQDMVSYASSAAAVTVNLELATAQVSTGDASGNVLSSIENITGSRFSDRLSGNGSDNLLLGGDGNDTLIGLAGADTLRGEGGIDTADYSASSSAVTIDLRHSGQQTSAGDASGDVLIGIENLIGSIFNDHLTGDDADNRFFGLAGADTIDGSGGRDIVDYGRSITGVTVDLRQTAAQVSLGEAAGDVLISIEDVAGSGLNDIITGNSVDNQLFGGGGDDVLAGLSGNDTLNGGAGSDTANYSLSTSGVSVDLRETGPQVSQGDAAGDVLISIENLVGSNFDDVLIGTTGINRLEGGQGNDTLIGVSGFDTLDGGVGFDIADFSSATSAVIVDLRLTTPQVAAGSALGVFITGVEGLTGTAFADSLAGDLQANFLRGGAGNDRLNGREGSDTLDGGDGIDTAVYLDSTQGVTVSLLQATQTSNGEASGDVLISIENVEGSNHGDRITGNEAANTIAGLGGADTLDGGDGIDTVDYSASGAGVVVDLRLTSAQISQGDANGDLLSSFENITGSGLADNLTGNSAANVLTGGGGDDILYGLGGADTLIGGSGTDTADYSSSAVGVTVNLALATAQISSGDASGDVLSLIENVTGSAFADVLRGDDNVNFLSGGTGNDTLFGGGGADFLSGGAGDDLLIGPVDGSDRLNGGSGIDTARFTEAGNVQLNSLFNIEILDFRNSLVNSATINAATLSGLQPESNTLIINRDLNDNITLTGANNTNSSVVTGGSTYQIYSMLNDDNQAISIHLQIA